jgi:hypothetical protein
VIQTQALPLSGTRRLGHGGALSSLVLNSAGLRRSVVRAGPYGCGPTRIRQPARSLLCTILTLILLCNRPSVLVVTLAVGQVTKAAPLGGARFERSAASWRVEILYGLAAGWRPGHGAEFF